MPAEKKGDAVPANARSLFRALGVAHRLAQHREVSRRLMNRKEVLTSQLAAVEREIASVRDSLMRQFGGSLVANARNAANRGRTAAKRSVSPETRQDGRRGQTPLGQGHKGRQESFGLEFSLLGAPYEGVEREDLHAPFMVDVFLQPTREILDEQIARKLA